GVQTCALPIFTSILFACEGQRPHPPPPVAAAGAALRPFVCEGQHCTQRQTRLPDDGEWTCADAAGAALCVGGEPAAGVAPGPPDPAWTCGPRRGARRDALGVRVCMDPSPDSPDGRMTGWRCRYLHDPPLRRVCDRDPAARTLGETCD